MIGTGFVVQSDLLPAFDPNDVGCGKCWYESHENRIQNHQFDDRGITPSTVKYLEVTSVNGDGKQTRS